jgi:arylsulfate sulfotransferase
MPVFGLYEGHQNQVSIDGSFDDGSTLAASVVLATDQYVDPAAIYDRPEVLRARQPGSPLGFDYFLVKSGLGMPLVIDTDGEVRWTLPGTNSSLSSMFHQGSMYIGRQDGAGLQSVDLHGGRILEVQVGGGVGNFHHNFDRGKLGILAEVDTASDIESTLVELDPGGSIIRTWDFAAIIRERMLAGGDDPDLFVRPGTDWFHMNAATYDPRDDSIIASSRENFLIKVDYYTGRILWILGDPSKYWHTFPSLRTLALRLEPGGLHPIGQHSVSVTPDGMVLAFNNGLSSSNQPDGAPEGEDRDYSVVSGYVIDQVNASAREALRFDYGRSILSRVCSSAYRAEGSASMLVSYSFTEGGTRARLVGVDDDGAVAFDFRYASRGCNTSWNALPVAFHDLVLD